MNKLDSIRFIKKIDECPDLSYLTQFENSKDPEEQKYHILDQERLRQYNNGDWCMLGIYAEAKILIPSDQGGYITQHIKSPGLWGIESDSNETYFNEVAQEEKEQLKDMLKELNVDLSTFDQINGEWKD